jgi:hypothetical protein
MFVGRHRAWLFGPLLLQLGCGPAIVAVDYVRGWVGLDEEEAETPAEPTAAEPAESPTPGGTEAKTVAAVVPTPTASTSGAGTSGGPSGDGSTTGGGATSGVASDEGGTSGGAGSDEGASGGDATSGGDAGDEDTGTGTGGNPWTPGVSAVGTADADAECLAGTWRAEDLGTTLRAAVARHARGGKLKVGKITGTYELTFTPDKATTGTVQVEAKARVHRFSTELARLAVSYTARLGGSATSSYEVTAPGQLRIDGPSKGGISSRLTVDIEAQKQANRPLDFPTSGTFEAVCDHDDLTLRAVTGKRVGPPMTLRRK